jgi:YbbR domain-containing protein
MKDKLKAMFTRNIGMKLVSILIAFIVWITIINLSDPTITRTISGIPIEWRNKEVVNSATTSYVADSDVETELTIRIEGVRSKIENLTKDDFIAYIDFNEMSSVNAVPVHVVPKNEDTAADVDIIRQSETMIRGKIEEKKESRGLPVVVRTENVPAGYYAYVSKQDNKTFSIYGPKDLVDQVKSFVATVDLQNSSQDVVDRDVKLVAYDAEGNVVEADMREFSIQSTISVSIDLLPIQEKKVRIDWSGVTANEGFGIVEKESSLDSLGTIKLAGRPEALNRIGSELVIKYEKRDLMESVDINNVSLAEYLPTGVYVASENTTFTVKITVAGENTKDFVVKTSDIRIERLDKAFSAAFKEESVQIRVYEIDKYLVTLNATNLELYVDLSEVTETGTVTAELRSKLNGVPEGTANIDDDLTTYTVTVELEITEAKDDRESGL